jgi:mannosyltransferase OCH1-like enzyme
MNINNMYRGFFYVFIILTIFIFFYYKINNNVLVEKFTNNNSNNSIIPLYIFQTWDKPIPPKMKECMNNIQLENPEFEYHCFDQTECYDFIKNNFAQDVLIAYDNLIPGAYKADLWRYCVLYIHGGIYLDAKMKPVNGFKFSSLTDKEYFVRDLDFSGKGIWNGFMVCKAENPKLLNAINEVVINVKNRFYGSGVLEPTGPMLLKKQFTDFELNTLDYEVVYVNGEMVIKNTKNNNIIIEKDKNITKEQTNTSSKKHYSILWKEKEIYKE